jgi:hypothetical protein
MLKNLRYQLIFSEAILFIGLAVCILIRPAGLAANNGISYYGTFHNTLLPYIIALAGSSFCLVLITIFYLKGSWQDNLIKTIFTLLFFLIIGIIIFPYNVNRTYADIHATLGTIIFSTQFIISIIFTFINPRDIYGLIILIIEFVGGLVSIYYLKPAHGFLIQGQIIAQFGFALFIIHNRYKIFKSVKIDQFPVDNIEV